MFFELGSLKTAKQVRIERRNRTKVDNISLGYILSRLDQLGATKKVRIVTWPHQRRVAKLKHTFTMEGTTIQKLLFLNVFVVSLIVLVCFLTTALTNQMVRGRVTHPEVETENYGDIQFGLFWGTKQYNYGFGERDEQRYIVYNEYADVHNTGLIITTLCLVGVAAIFMVPSIAFALMNTLTIPTKELYGIRGLFIWNGTAAVSSLLAIIFYTSIFYAQLKKHIESSDEQEFGVDDNAKPRVGYSFWVLLVGMVLVTSNVGAVYLTKRVKDDPNFFKRTGKVDNLEDTLTKNQLDIAIQY